MSEEQKQEWLELFSELIGEADYLEERGYSKRAAELSAKAEGMQDALEIFGYTVEEQYNEMLDAFELVIVKG